MTMFWERGFEATSIGALATAIGVHPPSLYAAFGDKKQLFREAIAAYEAEHGTFIVSALTEEPTARQAIERLLIEAAESYTTAGQPSGCMIVLAGTNCAQTSDSVVADLAAKRRAGERAIAARIARGIADTELPSGTNADALAAYYSTVLHGLSIAARDGVPREVLESSATLSMAAWPAQP